MIGRHVMIDVETLGCEPGCIILSIGAVTFNPFNPYYKSDEFYQNIDPEDSLKHGFTTSPETVSWWKKQSDEAKNALVENRIGVKDALNNFNQWFKKVNGMQFWCQGANFDAPIVEKAIRMVGSTPSWSFWNVRDTRTVYDICDFDTRKIKRKGTYHNALEDCKFQVECVQQALKGKLL